MKIIGMHDASCDRVVLVLEKVNTALQHLKNQKVLLKDPVRPNEGP